VFSGSFILKNGDIAKRDVNANNAYRLVKDDDNESDEEFAERVSKSVRYFSPTELCRLHGIKDDFVFPPSLSMRQQYKLIGNGISVHVVAKLLEYLFK
jgi:site-specific DNA-cytosine methylase